MASVKIDEEEIAQKMAELMAEHMVCHLMKLPPAEREHRIETGRRVLREMKEVS